jgi:hypothetical protein
MKSPSTKEKYLLRLGKFLDFANLDGHLQDRARIFAEMGTKDSIWAFNTILGFMQLLKERVVRKEITAGTIRNYVKSIKLFCQMADIPISWDKITRGLPRGRRYAEDRAPTLDEIKILAGYPDRRIKPVVYTIIPCVGAWDYLRWGNIHPVEEHGKIIAARILVCSPYQDKATLNHQ